MNDYRLVERWKNVSIEEWKDWRWQYENRITTMEQLKEIITLNVDEEDKINQCLYTFRMAITPYYAMLINPQDQLCPIRMQSIPSVSELIVEQDDLADPLGEEKYSPVPGLVHKYPDRVLFLITARCSMYCRHCTRRRFAGNEDFHISREAMNDCIEYIRQHKEVRDVLLSGGDPFILSDEFLETIIMQLRAIPHVEIVRIGTRTPVVMPMRITDELLRMLRKYQPIWINTHFNHPNEITMESMAACEKIVDAGIPLGNQTVLLRGINDNAGTMKELFLKLVQHRVRPYYLYQCDIAQGIGHFRTPIESGLNIMAQLRGYISGFAMPTFVVDAPNGGGKIPIQKDYLVSVDGNNVILRNYKDEIYMYPNARQFRVII